MTLRKGEGESWRWLVSSREKKGGALTGVGMFHEPPDGSCSNCDLGHLFTGIELAIHAIYKILCVRKDCFTQYKSKLLTKLKSDR